ncbi:hypothetical protein ES703_65750 [subsurface metagenome]
MLGKMPRRKTDPAQALRKSLIPGQGLYYNGYKKLGLIIPAILLFDSFVSPLIFHGALQQKEEWEESKTEIDTNPPGTYWDWRDYYAKEDIYKTQLQEGLITAGSGLFIYLFSILDSRISASNDFLYPTFLELSVGGCCAYTHQVQTTDTNPEFHPDLLPYVTSGLSSFYPGGYFSMIFRGRKYLIDFALDFTGEPLLMNIGLFGRIPVSENFFIGPGMRMIFNFGEQKNAELAEEGREGLKPLPDRLTSLALSLSLQFTRFELDLFLSPYTLGTGKIYLLYGTNDWTENVQTSGLFGFSGGGKLTLYFNLNTGITLSADYYYLWNTNEEMAADGYSTIDRLQFLTAKAGMVFRF